ncbi:2145_t:CDS:1 [Acaulospora colombiana]|uniref:2145_t:CDS:1 n=1 Tax=Acaulospora colombiana TaxID=27376 RepID=A0ACA9MJH9_9GLOM|nr:2145_t:CDS:1 [Acaulospora colombiana]
MRIEEEAPQPSSSATPNEDGLKSGPSNINGLISDDKVLENLGNDDLGGSGEGSNENKGVIAESANSSDILNVPSNTPTNFIPKTNLEEEEIHKIDNALNELGKISENEMENGMEKEVTETKSKKNRFVKFIKNIKKILKGRWKKG